MVHCSLEANYFDINHVVKLFITLLLSAPKLKLVGYILNQSFFWNWDFCQFWSNMALKSISQGNFKTSFGGCNRPIFAIRYQKKPFEWGYIFNSLCQKPFEAKLVKFYRLGVYSNSSIAEFKPCRYTESKMPTFSPEPFFVGDQTPRWVHTVRLRKGLTPRSVDSKSNHTIF